MKKQQRRSNASRANRHIRRANVCGEEAAGALNTTLSMSTEEENDCQEYQDAVDALELMLQDTQEALELAKQDLDFCLNSV